MAAYAALYRTWRPRRLADIAGQEHVTRTLLHALRQGHPAHAYLFCGPRGTGKTSTARILAAALNCQHPEDGDACANCENCQAVAQDRFLDVQEIDAASHRQVDDVRALRERVGYAPAAGRHKVYILDEVHMLTEASWNTLLKTLEEPPPNTTFILCTTDPRKVLPTVVSRCQRFDFRRLTGEEIEARLREVCRAEGIGAAPDALHAVARRADGSLRDALAILDQLAAYVARPAEITPHDVAAVTGSADEESIAALLRAAAQGDVPEAFRGVERLYAQGKDMAQVCRDLAAALRDRLAGEVHGPAVPTPDPAWTLRAIQVLAEAEGHMRRWAQPRLVLEVTLLELMPTVTAPRRPEPAPAHVTEIPATRPPKRESAGTDIGRAAEPAPVATPHGTQMVSLWEALLQQLRHENAPAAAIVAEGVLQDAEPGTLRIRFPAPTHAEVAERHRPRISAIAAGLAGAAVRVEFTAPADGASTRQPSSAQLRGRDPARPGERATGADGHPRRDAEAAFRRALTRFDGTPLDNNDRSDA